MTRHAVEIKASREEHDILKKMVNARTTPKNKSLRAEIILQCLQGKQNRQIAKDLNLCEQTVAKWRGRFAEKRLDGLNDSSRSREPRKYGKNVRDSIIKALEQPPPKGFSCWDGNSLSNFLNIPKHAIWAILRSEGIHLQRKRSWCVSTDKEFATKSADVIGLYLNPPENALVICVDEKPSIQAIERPRGYVETSNGKIVQGLKSTYKRHGTLNLFAALNVATGCIKGKTTDEKKRKDFQSFLDDIVADVPYDQEIHIIMDNYCTHKRNDEWLKKHPNVFFHFAPSSSKCNKIDRIFDHCYDGRKTRAPRDGAAGGKRRWAILLNRSRYGSSQPPSSLP